MRKSIERKTFGEILEDERNLVLLGAEYYGDYYKNAVDLLY